MTKWRALLLHSEELMVLQEAKALKITKAYYKAKA